MIIQPDGVGSRGGAEAPVDRGFAPALGVALDMFLEEGCAQPWPQVVAARREGLDQLLVDAVGGGNHRGTEAQRFVPNGGSGRCVALRDMWSGSAFSLPPLLVPHRKTIQLIPVELPARHEAIHQTDEAPVVGWFKEMRHFVNDDVFQAFAWLFGEVSV